MQRAISRSPVHSTLSSATRYSLPHIHTAAWVDFAQTVKQRFHQYVARDKRG
jgi:hypothetical protein